MFLCHKRISNSINNAYVNNYCYYLSIGILPSVSFLIYLLNRVLRLFRALFKITCCTVLEVLPCHFPQIVWLSVSYRTLYYDRNKCVILPTRQLIRAGIRLPNGASVTIFGHFSWRVLQRSLSISHQRIDRLHVRYKAPFQGPGIGGINHVMVCWISCRFCRNSVHILSGNPFLILPKAISLMVQAAIKSNVYQTTNN